MASPRGYNPVDLMLGLIVEAIEHDSSSMVVHARIAELLDAVLTGRFYDDAMPGHVGGSENAKAVLIYDTKRNTYVALALNTAAPGEAIVNHLLKSLDGLSRN